MEFQQIKTGKNITLISDDTIEKIAQVKVFPDNEANILLYKHHKNLLRIAQKKNNSKEVGLFWNMNDYDSEPLRIYGGVNGFSISNSDSVRRLLNDYRNHVSIVVMHNHPRNGLFSGKDIRSFIDFNSICVMTAVCNDGTIYLLKKEENFNPLLMGDYYNEGVRQSEKATKNEIIRKAKALKINLNDKERIKKIQTKPYYYGIKNVAKHSKEIGITYRCSVKRK